MNEKKYVIVETEIDKKTKRNKSIAKWIMAFMGLSMVATTFYQIIINFL